MYWIPVARLLVNDAPHPGARAQLEILMAREHGQQRVGGLRLRADHATEALAETAIGARRTHDAVRILVRLAQVRRGTRKRVVAELFRRLLEQRPQVGRLERRRGIFILADALKRIAALHRFAAQITGLAADAEHPFGVPVVRLEVIVGDPPIGDRQVSGQTAGSVLLLEVGRQHEHVRKKTNGPPVPVLPRAADTRSGKKRPVLAHRHGCIAQGVAMRHRVVGNVLHQFQTDGVVELIHAHRVVSRFPRAAALHHQDRMRGAAGNILGHREAGPSASDDRHVHWLQICHLFDTYYQSPISDSDSSVASLRRPALRQSRSSIVIQTILPRTTHVVQTRARKCITVRSPESPD
jgi:hypothetical protein